MQGLWRRAILICLVAATGAARAASQPSTFEVLAQMPKCAQPCVLTAVTNSTCSPTDQACVCTNEELQSAAEICIRQNCSIKEGLFMKNITATTCGAPVRNKQRPYVILSDTLGIFIGISVLQRILAKLYWRLGLAMDDWCILLTTIFLTVPSLVINVYGLVANGMGRDVWTLTPEEITNFGTFFHVMAVLYFSQISLIKLTLLFFYLRVFSVAGRYRYILIGTIVFNCVYGVIYIFVTIFQCWPVGYMSVRWDGEHEGTCFNINAMTWSNAAISIAVDLWMLIIPMLQIRSLQLDYKKKVGAALMFFVGTAFTVISIIRLHVLVTFDYVDNPTWAYLEISKWSTLEIATGVICSCMPSYRVLLVRMFPRIFSSRHRFTTNESNSASYMKSGRSVHGSFATSQAGGAGMGNNDSRGIVCSRSYNIEYDDVTEGELGDQSQLVRMKHMDTISETKGAHARVEIL